VNINPWIRLVYKLNLTLFIGISVGTVSLTNIIDDPWLAKHVLAWCGLLAFIMSAGSNIFDAMSATMASQVSRVDGIPGVKVTVGPAAQDSVKAVAADPLLPNITLKP